MGYFVVESISTALKFGEEQLSSLEFDHAPRLHAELMLQAALGIDRASLYLNPGRMLTEPSEIAYSAFLARRHKGEPLQHILGWAAFYGNKFKVGDGAFIPRFDSEAMVERAIAILESRTSSLEVLDLCCGSGAIGLSIAAELHDVRLTLLDSEPTPLKYAALNAEALNLSSRTSIVRASALGPFPESWHNRFDLIVANPPYIPISEISTLPVDVREGDPLSALTDGGDGLSFYRAWSLILPGVMKTNGIFLTEIGDGAVNQVTEILSPWFIVTDVINDCSGNQRSVECRSLTIAD